MPTTVITGADSRIGGSVVRRLHADGHQVVAVGRDMAVLEEDRRELGDDRFWALLADLRSPTICAGVLSEVVERHGSVDGVVTHVGSDELWSDPGLGSDSWKRAFADALVGCHQFILEARAALTSSGGSAVVVSAAAPIATVADDTAVATSAATASDGVRNVVRSLALDIGSTRGLRVNGVAPSVGLDPAEIADVVGFLLGADARMVSGSIALVADQGHDRSSDHSLARAV